MNDLAPLAEAREQPVIYASFWQTPFSPLDLADATANGWMLADPEFAAWVRETGREALLEGSEPE